MGSVHRARDTKTMVDQSASPTEIARSLAVTRRLRWTAFISLFGPPIVTIVIVAGNKLSNGGLAFFANGAPWTHRFWSGLFYVLVVGVILSLATVGRRCPRCGDGFFVSRDYRRQRNARSSRGGVNVFARRCVNCGLSIRGVDETAGKHV